MKNKSSRARVCAVLLVFFAVVFLLPASRTGNSRLYMLATAVACGTVLLLLIPSRIFALDRPLMAASILLCGFGIMAPVLAFPDESVSQGLRCLPALFFLLAGCVVVRSYRLSWTVASVTALCSLTLFSAPLLFPAVSFSFTEGGTVLMLFAVSAFLFLRLRLPALIFALSALALIMVRYETGAALVWAVTAAFIFWAASDSIIWSVLSLVLCTGFTAGFFAVFQGLINEAKDSILPRIASIPMIPPEWSAQSASASENSLFILLGEQFGLIIMLCSLLLLCMILIRAASVSLHARKTFHSSLSLGVLLLLGLKGLLFMLSLTDLIPVPPGSFPLMSSAVPDLCAEFFMLGILSGVSAQNEEDLREDARLSMLAH